MSLVPDSSTSVDPSVSSIVNPATSSSVVTTETVWSATLLKSESDIESTIVIVMVEFWSPSMMSSSAPVTVTVCAVSQFAGVKEIVPDIVASPVSLEDIAITTLSLGCASRTIVNVSVVPDSSTSVEPSNSSTVNPATSSSVVSTETVWLATASKSLSELASSTATVIVEVIVPSIMLSSTPVTVTVCGVSQFADVKVSELLPDASPASLKLTVTITSDVG